MVRHRPTKLGEREGLAARSVELRGKADTPDLDPVDRWLSPEGVAILVRSGSAWPSQGSDGIPEFKRSSRRFLTPLDHV
jgi:hypothetical protein